jgi:hypothetical protein
MMTLDNKFEYGDIVYLKTDPDQLGRLITGITYRGSIDNLVYELSYCDDGPSQHRAVEISEEPDELLKLNIKK